MQGKHRRNTANHRQAILGLHSEEAKVRTQVEEESKSQKKHSGKKATMGTVCYI